MNFDELSWQDDRMIFRNLVFRIQHHIDDEWELGDECFMFYKIKPLVDQYSRFFALKPEFRPENVLELGMWDGGSIAFWFELLRPSKHVGIDLNSREDSAYFRSWIASRELGDRVKTYWGTNQTDAARLQDIVEKECGGKLNLVIDDASHMYGLTKRSFEILFPLVEPGGLYVIEDWAWSHWSEFHALDHPWITKTPLTNLVVELLEATGSWESGSEAKLIETVTVYQGFVVIERGDLNLSKSEDFKLEQHISRRPRLPIYRRALRELRGLLDRHVLWRLK